MSFKLTQTEAIVLSSKAYKESDSLILLLTPDRGKVSSIAKGARKPTNKRAGKLQPFSHVLVQLHQGRNLFTITQVDSIKLFAGILYLYERILAAETACDMMGRVVQEGQESHKIFNYLLNFLKTIENEDSLNALLLGISFEMGALGILGFEPRLFSCVVCLGASNAPVGHLNYRKGGLICSVCARGGDNLVIESENLKFLQLLYRASAKFKRTEMKLEKENEGSTKPAKKILVTTDKLRFAIFFLDAFTSEHLGIKLKMNEYVLEASSRLMKK